jgi:GrpB-like predicted nucleotidyltransferase (UPF0157 family)
MITLSEHDPDWPARFEEEARRLRAAFGSSALRIEHVGSTSIPGIAAKPVIDIQVSVASLAPHGRFVDTMASLGYRHEDLGDFDRVYPFFHRPAEGPATHHVHLCEARGEQERRHLTFRDHLRAHPRTAARYEALKRELARTHDASTLQSREAYSLAKSGFIADVLRAAMDDAIAQAAIDALIARFFSAFDNRNGAVPRLAGLVDCFTRKAVIARHANGASDLDTVEEFALPRIALLTDGKLLDFHEWETSATTRLHGGIATRTSRYAKSGLLEGQPYGGSGTKCFQLVDGDTGWRIASLAWVDDDA